MKDPPDSLFKKDSPWLSALLDLYFSIVAVSFIERLQLHASNWGGGESFHYSMVGLKAWIISRVISGTSLAMDHSGS